jgi:hypothetical protein
VHPPPPTTATTTATPAESRCPLPHNRYPLFQEEVNAQLIEGMEADRKRWLDDLNAR